MNGSTFGYRIDKVEGDDTHPFKVTRYLALATGEGGRVSRLTRWPGRVTLGPKPSRGDGLPLLIHDMRRFMVRYIADIKVSGEVRYYVIENSTSGLIMGAYLGTTEEEALDALARDAGYPADHAHEHPTDTDDLVASPLWAVGDRVEGGDIPEDYDTGTVVALGDEVYDLEPHFRGYGFVSPVLVAWDTGVSTVAEALELRAEGENPQLPDEETD